MDAPEAHSPSPADKDPQASACSCPACGALLYSHRAKICGQCGAVIAPETFPPLPVDDRQWARDLADKFSLNPRASESSRAAGITAEEPDMEELQAKLRRISCAIDFKHRPRPVWLYVGGCACLIAVSAALCWIGNKTLRTGTGGWMVFLFVAGYNLLLWFKLWQRAMPICPNCKQNIRICPAIRCQLCGKQLNGKRCTDCGVDNSWIGWLHPSSNGAFARIMFCPGCGVELNTWIRRWYADR
jgi:hypothetical protein